MAKLSKEEIQALKDKENALMNAYIAPVVLTKEQRIQVEVEKIIDSGHIREFAQNLLPWVIENYSGREGYIKAETLKQATRIVEGEIKQEFNKQAQEAINNENKQKLLNADSLTGTIKYVNSRNSGYIKLDDSNMQLFFVVGSVRGFISDTKTLAKQRVSFSVVDNNKAHLEAVSIELLEMAKS